MRFFRLGFIRDANTTTGRSQWQVEVEGKLYVPDFRSVLQPSDGDTHFLCTERRLVKKDESGMIISVELVRPLNEQEKREVLMQSVRSTLAPKPVARVERRRHNRSDYDRRLRESMRGHNPPADKHGHRQRKTA